jgi:hypothetical protein
MLIPLFALLGVDLIVIVVLLAIVISRRRWVSRQPAAFAVGRTRHIAILFAGRVRANHPSRVKTRGRRQ